LFSIPLDFKNRKELLQLLLLGFVSDDDDDGFLSPTALKFMLG